MALLHIPLDQIDEARLQALIDDGAAESRTIDYKRTIYGTADSDYSEFLADTSSFANTSAETWCSAWTRRMASRQPSRRLPAH